MCAIIHNVIINENNVSLRLFNDCPKREKECRVPIIGTIFLEIPLWSKFLLAGKKFSFWVFRSAFHQIDKSDTLMQACAKMCRECGEMCRKMAEDTSGTLAKEYKNSI